MYGKSLNPEQRQFDPEEIDWYNWNEARIKRYIRMNGETPDGKRTLWHAQFMVWLGSNGNNQRPLIKYRLGMDLTNDEWIILTTSNPHIEQELYTEVGAAEIRKQQDAPAPEPKTRPEKQDTPQRRPQSHKPKYNVTPPPKPPSHTPGRQVNYTPPSTQYRLDDFGRL